MNALVSSSARPILACVVPFMSPFRLHFFRRIAREMPAFQIATLVTQNPAEYVWEYGEHPEIGLVNFGMNTPWQHSAPPWKSAPADWGTGGRLIAWLAARDVRAVFLAGYAYPSHTRLILSCHRRRVPLMLWGDSNILGDRSMGLKRIVKNALLPRLIRRCAAILPCGTNGDAFFRRYGSRPERTFFCPAEPDYDLIDRPDPMVLRAAGEKHGLDPRRKRFMCCARLVELKRYDAAIDAFARIATLRPEFDLLMVGDGEMRQAWQSRVPPHLANRVLWTGFVKDAAEIAALYRWCHVLVHPGDYEAWGMVIVEAAAAGMSIIASQVVGAARDLIHDGESGRIVPPGDVSAIAGAMLELTETDTLERAREASRAVARAWRTNHDPITGLGQAIAAITSITAREAHGQREGGVL
ncbi:glycosyltransferase [bacterium]|nr:MAG: glycosyltransferase [bacterium]